MQWGNLPPSILVSLIAGTMMLGVMSYFFWARQSRKGARAFALVMLAAMLWAIIHTLSWVSINLQARILLIQAQFIGILLIPPALIYFAVQYTQIEERFQQRHFMMLVAIHLVILCLVLTNELHHLIWKSFVLAPDGQTLDITRAPLFWGLLGFLYLGISIGIFILIWHLTTSPGSHYWEFLALSVGGVAPLMANVVYLRYFDSLPIPGLDITPYAFFISGSMLFFAYQKRSFHLNPIARKQLIEEMPIGMLILDSHLWITDVNPAARQLLGLAPDKLMGRPLAEIAPETAVWINDSIQNQVMTGQSSHSTTEGERYLSWQQSLLHDKSGQVTGYLFSIRDLTDYFTSQITLGNYANHLEILQKIYQSILAAHHTDEIAIVALQYIQQLIPAQRASITFFQPDKVIASIMTRHDNESVEQVKKQAVPLSIMTLPKELLEGQLVQVKDLSALPDPSLMQKTLIDEGIQSYVNIPMLVQEKIIGTLNLGTTQSSHFTEEQIGIAREIGSLLAIAINQASLHEQTEVQAQQLRLREIKLNLLNEITATAAGDLDFSTMLQKLADRLAELFEADGCHIALWDTALNMPIPTVSSGTYRVAYQTIQPIANEATLTMAVLQEKRPIAIEDTSQTSLISPRIARHFPNIASILGLPLLANEQRLGTAIILYEKPHKFSDEEFAWGEQASGQISLALVKAQLLEAEREQRVLAETMQEVGSVLSSTLNPDLVLDRLVDGLKLLVPYDYVTIMLAEQGRATIARHRQVNHTDRPTRRELIAPSFVIQDTPNLMEMVDSGQPVIIGNVADFPDWINTTPDTENAIASWAGVAVFTNGMPIAFIEVRKNELNFYRDEHARKLILFADKAALALQNAWLFQSARRQLEELTVLNAVASLATAALDEDTFIMDTAQIISNMFFPDKFGVLLVDKTQQQLEAHTSNRSPNNDRQPIIIPVTQGVSGRVFRTKTAALVTDTSQDPDYVAFDPATRSELCVPLIAGDQRLGVLNVESHQLNAFADADTRLLNILASQMATAVAKIRLITLERQQRHEAETLRETSAALTAMLDLEDVLANILTQLKNVIDYDSSSVFLLHEHSIEYVASRGLPPEVDKKMVKNHFPRKNPLFQLLQQEKRPLILPDVKKDKRFANWGGVDYIHGWMGVPLIVRNQVIGAMTIDSRHINAYREHDAMLAQTFAYQAATAIENARLYQAEQKAREISDILRDASRALTRSLDLNSILDTLLEYLEQLVPFDSANIMLLNDSGQMIISATRGYGQWSNVADIKQLEIDITEDIFVHSVVTQKRSILVADTRQDSNWKRYAPTEYIFNWIGVPLIVGGKVIGLYSIDKAEPNFFTAEHITLAEALASQTAVILQNAQLFEKTQRSATELSIASNILRLLNATPVITDIFPELARELKEISNGDWVSLTLLDETKQWATMMALDKPTTTLSTGTRFPVSVTESAAKILAGEINITPDLAQVRHYPAEQMLYDAGHRSRINIPLIIGHDVIGALNVVWDTINGYDDTIYPLLNQVTSAIALALERTRLFDEINLRAHQLTILNELSQQITGVLELKVLCKTVVTIMVESFKYLSASIFTIDPDKNEVVLQGIYGPRVDQINPDEYRQAIGDGLIGQVALTGSVIVANDTSQEPLFIPSTRIDVKAELVLPIKTGDQVIGILNLDSSQINAFMPGDVATMTVVADQLAGALEKARLFEEIRDRTTELETIIEISTALRQTNSAEGMMPLILEKAMAVVGGMISTLFIINTKRDKLIARAVYPPDPSLLYREMVLGEGISGHVAQTGQISINEDMSTNKHAFFLPSEEKRGLQRAVKSNITLPLLTQEQVIGVLSIGIPVIHRFSQSEVRVLIAIAEVAGFALDRAFVLESLEDRVAKRTRALVDANSQLQELDELKSKFVSDVSHELRTPITNLGLYLDLLQRGNPDKQEQYISVLQKQVGRLTNLTEDILNLSRLEMGGAPALTAVDLNNIVSQQIHANQLRAEKSGLHFAVSLQPDLPPVYGNSNQISQVIANLLTNAINYTPEGSISVRSFVNSANQRICLEIKDTGLGIAQEDQPHLFDRFYRGKNVSQSNIPGTGLGLAIVREILLRHQGNITVESVENKGTTIQIWLPMERHHQASN